MPILTPDTPVIVAARRTPIGRAGGMLAALSLEDLVAPVLRAVIADAGIDPPEIGEVILGNAAGPGGNPARVAALAAGLPVRVPAVTVDRQCGSGLEAIVMGARLIQAGAAEVVLAGGFESASTAPWRVEKPRTPLDTPRLYTRARFAPDAIGDPDMGVAAENVARARGISRARQDAYALNSHRKAVAAQREGRFDAEIVPLDLPGGGRATADECPRPDTTLEQLAALPPVFAPDGTVTAGNACPVNDGAAVVAIVRAARFIDSGLPGAMRFFDAAAAGVDPNLLGLGPGASTRRLVARWLSLDLDVVDVVEFNEAFAAQVLACLDELAIPESSVNVNGGALALGHPWGASGAILVTRLFTEMVRVPQIRRETALPGSSCQPPRLGLATLGIAGGMGLSALFERL